MHSELGGHCAEQKIKGKTVLVSSVRSSLSMFEALRIVFNKGPNFLDSNRICSDVCYLTARDRFRNWDTSDRMCKETSTRSLYKQSILNILSECTEANLKFSYSEG